MMLSPYEQVCLRLSERISAGGHKTRRPAKHRDRLLRIAARDGNMCHLCQQPVDMPRIRHADPDGPSLDHVVPKSLGGEKRDSNLKLAHKDCNARRGNTPLQENK